MHDHFDYVIITQDCEGVEKNAYNMPISYFTLRENEVFKVNSVYNYYDADNENWNTEHPIVEITFTDSEAYMLYYELPPGSYEYINMDQIEAYNGYAGFSLGAELTTFRVIDMVEREESINDNKQIGIDTANQIIKRYLAVQDMNKAKLIQYQWPHTLELQQQPN